MYEDCQAKQADAKEGKSSRVVGGRSQWGKILDVVCAKYGWTYHYTLWGVSYQNLSMMLADTYTTLIHSKGSKENNNENQADILRKGGKVKCDGFANFLQVIKSIK